MNNVDRIITYLSDEMTGEEAAAFRKELESDDTLKDTFTEVSAVFQLMSVQLGNMDEERFRTVLKEAMDRSDQKRSSRTNSLVKLRKYLIPAAAAITLGIALWLMDRNQDRLLVHYFQPGKDPVILAAQQGVRGTEGKGVVLYRQGHFRESGELMLEMIREDPGHKMAILFYLLSYIQSDLPADSLAFSSARVPVPGNTMDEAIVWYHALALLKSGDKTGAARVLHNLKSYKNPYQEDAHKLQKILLK